MVTSIELKYNLEEKTPAIHHTTVKLWSVRLGGFIAKYMTGEWRMPVLYRAKVLFRALRYAYRCARGVVAT